MGLTAQAELPRYVPYVIGALLIGSILYMAAMKTGLMNSASVLGYDDPNCPDPFGDYEQYRKEILDVDGHIQTLNEQLAHTSRAFTADRISIQRNIDDLEAYKKSLEDRYGHCSGWGDH